MHRLAITAGALAITVTALVLADVHFPARPTLTEIHETSNTDTNDGLIDAPYAIPAQPRYPQRCAHEGYCTPGIDSPCTIAYVGLGYGTDPHDIAHGLRVMWPGLSPAAFADCPEFSPLYELGLR